MEHNYIKEGCISAVDSKFQLNLTIIAPVTAFQRKSIIVFWTVVVTLNTVRNDLERAQIKDMGPMNRFT